MLNENEEQFVNYMKIISDTRTSKKISFYMEVYINNKKTINQHIIFHFIYNNKQIGIVHQISLLHLSSEMIYFFVIKRPSFFR